mmetsp:Transcript_33518/g.75259  ORF Transcript_33518/g.75259 Transcript_33518/m.75259 type:complete len:87 (-) Transcript_33518:2238-2498(-)
MHTGADRETNSWDGSRIVVQFSDIEGFPSCLIQPASSNLLEAMHINAQPAPEQWISADLGGAVEQLYETFGSPGNLTFPSLTRWTA